MGTKDIQAKYGGNTRSAVNRAIRAELPGGDVLLDLRTWWHHRDSGEEKNHTIARLDEILLDCENEIRRRYDMNILNSNSDQT